MLTGIIGAYRPIAEAQSIAKDLITQTRSIFESRQNQKKIAERDQLALKILEKYAPLFVRINNHTLKGCYSM